MIEKVPAKLEAGESVNDVAEAAREALRALLLLRSDEGALLDWFLGPYRRATRYATYESARLEAPRVADAHDLLPRAQAFLAGALTAALSPGAEELIRQLPAVVHVRPISDQFGGRGFAPVDVPRTRLVDRGLSPC